MVFEKGYAVAFAGQPNEWPLSCGAKLWSSQMKFYSTRTLGVNDSGKDGRRQLQRLVRLPRPPIGARIQCCGAHVGGH